MPRGRKPGTRVSAEGRSVMSAARKASCANTAPLDDASYFAKLLRCGFTPEAARAAVAETRAKPAIPAT